MHNAAFAALGLDFVYVALRVRPPDLRRAVLGIRALGFVGLNVTVPHKEAIIPLLDDLSPAARAIGAVNTVVWHGGRLEGHNTDAPGFIRAVRKLGFKPRGKTAVILGAGGSARAVAWALADAEIRTMTILNRNVRRAGALAGALRSHTRTDIKVCPLATAQRVEVVADADLIVNCTSLGLDGKTAPPVAITAAPKHCLFYDLVYRPRATLLVENARKAGRKAENGERMLVEQAALAFRLWTSCTPPIRAMERALQVPAVALGRSK
jgi:shikimate dehydrogenase